MILHVDMDCFFVSVERLRDPALVGVPVAVGGTPGGRGVIASASYEARRFGVRSAMATAHALRLCPHLVVVPHTAPYGEYSRRVQDIFERFTPLVQMASLDEGYLDLAGTERLWGPPLRAAEALRRAVWEETGLPCSLGLATNKLVSKVASDLCKPRGMLYIPAGSEAEFLAPLPVHHLPGVGDRTREVLERHALRRIGDLAAAGPARLERLFGAHGRDLADAATGLSRSSVTPHQPAKSIGNEQTFAEDIAERGRLESMLMRLVESVAGRLRQDGRLAQTFTLKYRYSDFETHTASESIAVPTHDDAEIYTVATRLLVARWSGAPLRLLGLTASGLVEADGQQLDLLAPPPDSAREKLLGAIDQVRHKHGNASLKRGTSLG